ncbi:unnamed protein product [Onchocerca flexuosa]|uniref:RRP15-like protein n=1 Tax=Onchocerca flexuosa TaxID=387005 RepID=A0A183HJ82_9BILA|nr:unnamed protein product [Onchocerca flexuosa]
MEEEKKKKIKLGKKKVDVVTRITKKIGKAAEVISKVISKDRVKEEKEKETGSTFRLGRFGAQFFAPVSRPSDDSIIDDDDESDGEDVESEQSED